MREVRVVPDIEDEVIAALNALRHRYTYVFTTGGIGPTHDDITADCVAKAFGVTIDVDPRARAILLTRDRREGHERGAAAHGAHSQGRRSHPQQGVGGARLPHRQRHRDGRRADHHAGDARRGRADAQDRHQDAVGDGARPNCREGDIGSPLGEIAKAHPDVIDRQLSVPGRRPAQHQHRGALARRAEARRRQDRRRGDAGAQVRGELASRPLEHIRRDIMARSAPSTGHRTTAPLPEKAFPVSWDQFHRDARALAWRLAAAGPFTAIVCITRGGLVPAAIVARELDVRLIETVCVESYHDYTTQGELRCSRASTRNRRQARRQGRADRRRSGRHRKDRQGRARAVCPGRISPPSMPSRWAGRWSTPSSPRSSQDTWIYFPWDTGLRSSRRSAKAARKQGVGRVTAAGRQDQPRAGRTRC